MLSKKLAEINASQFMDIAVISKKYSLCTPKKTVNKTNEIDVAKKETIKNPPYRLLYPADRKNWGQK